MIDKQPAGIPGLHICRQGGGTLDLFEGAGVFSAMPELGGFGGMHSTEGFGQLSFQYYFGTGFQIWYSGYWMERDITFVSRGDMEVLELHMPLLGEAMGWWDGVKHNSIRAQQFELEYAPFVYSEASFIHHCEVRTLDVHYTPAFLADFVGQYPQLDPFLRSVHDKQRGNLFSAVHLMNPAMHRIAQDILRYRGPADGLAAFYEERVTLLLHEVLSRTQHARKRHLTKRDIDAVTAVRELVQLQPHRVFTSGELGLYTGISVSKLHYTFKELCGTTLFDYSQGIRLDYALQLLHDTPALVQEVAWECGYTEHANFTAAFRKRFGCSPQGARSAKK